MKVILTETIDKVGKVGQVLSVKDGYARNYLLPKKFAIIANAANLKKIEEIEADAKAKADRKNIEYRDMARRVSSLTPSFTRRAEQDGKLFGSVSEVDIINFLEENEVTCLKSQIIMDKHIKTVGDFEVKVAFTSEITALLKIKVEAGE